MFDIDILGSLMPDPITMLAQLMATGILLLVFKKYLWAPVSDFLQKRADVAQQALDDAYQAKEEALEKQQQAKQQLQDASEKAQRIIERSENEAKKIKSQLLSDAQNQAKLKIEQANSQIELQRRELQSNIRKEIVDVAMLVSERLMHDKIDETFDRDVIQTFLKDVDKS